jgi:hypothetical protein
MLNARWTYPQDSSFVGCIKEEVRGDDKVCVWGILPSSLPMFYHYFHPHRCPSHAANNVLAANVARPEGIYSH